MENTSTPSIESASSSVNIPTEPLTNEIDNDFRSGFINDELQLETAIEEPTEEPIKKEIKQETFKMKVDGKEYDVPKEDVIKYAQQYVATQKRMEVMKSEKIKIDNYAKELDQVAGMLKSGKPEVIRDIFKRLDVDFDKIVIERARDLYAESQMPDSEKKTLKLQRELDEFKQRELFFKQQEHQRREQYNQQKAIEEISIEIPKAIKSVGLDDLPWVQQRIAQVWQAALSKNQTPTAIQVAQYVKKEVDEFKASSLKNTDADTLAKLLGPRAKEISEKISPQKRIYKSVDSPEQSSGKITYTKKSDWK